MSNKLERGHFYQQHSDTSQIFYFSPVKIQEESVLDA